MIKASYTYTDHSRKVFGYIEVSNEGKAKISISHATAFSAATRYQAKKLAEQIIAADFNHPAAYSVVRTESKTLVSLLTSQTKLLLDEYIDKTKKYCVRKYAAAVKRKNWNSAEWLKNFGYDAKTYSTAKEVIKVERKLDEYGRRLYSEDKRVLYIGLQKLIETEVKSACKHYANSIDKLAERLTAKGVTTDFKIVTSRVGVNIETVITHPDGNLTRAWTIIASGPIQRPHYRYLIK